MINTAIEAAEAAGSILKAGFGTPMQVDGEEQHDIKLEVDRQCEAAILKILRRDFPDHAILAEESGASAGSGHRWIIDPLDGTMNFFYGVPHFAPSIALEVNGVPTAAVVYDPMIDELFTAERGKGAFLNGKPIYTSPVTRADRAMVVCGFMKDEETIGRGVEAVERIIHKVRKVRCTGSAALDLAYVAAGRFTAYYEVGIRHWDIAAGRLLVEEAGGHFDFIETDEATFNVYCSNGLIHEALEADLPIQL